MGYLCMHLKFYDLSLRFYSVSLRKVNILENQTSHTFLQEFSWVTDLETCFIWTQTSQLITLCRNNRDNRKTVFLLSESNENTLFATLCCLYPGPRGFFWFFFAKEIKSKPRSGDNESRKRRGEREKPLVTLASNLTFMEKTAVKRVKLLIKKEWPMAI